MKALILTETGSFAQTPSPLTLRELPIPVPGEKDILIKVSACGVCHTELDIIEGRTPPSFLPIVLGHQVVGLVHQYGELAQRFKRGQRPRFGGAPTVACSDNASRQASRVAPELVAQIPVRMFRDLLDRRLFDGVRLFDRWYVLVVDGSVKEKCRQGFHEGGKSSTAGARYRYVLQLSILGPAGTLFPLLHEEMDLYHPQTQKEDCELKSFQRLSQRLKKEFPKLPICLVADALYACQAIMTVCQRYDWKYVLTLKEGRHPTTVLSATNRLHDGREVEGPRTSVPADDPVEVRMRVVIDP